jgi:cytochrome c oxidase assembly protein subunit 15
MASLLPGIRRAAPRLSRDFFVCHQCLKQPVFAVHPIKLPGKSTISKSIRFNSSAPDIVRNTSPLSSLSHTISAVERDVAQQTRQFPDKRFFPRKCSKGVAYWLLGSAASVFGIVVFGGLTRLTESGYVQLSSAET